MTSYLKTHSGDGNAEMRAKILNRAICSQNEAQKFTSIKIREDLAKVIRVYCIFNNRKVYDFTEEIFEKELFEFKKKLDSLKK